MGPRSRHITQEGVMSPSDKLTLLRKVQINPRTTAKDLVKMLEETGTNVYISTVKRVLNRQNLHKKARLRFAAAHGDKDHTFLRNVF